MYKACSDPVGCAQRAESWAHYQQENLSRGEELLEELREMRSSQKGWIRNTIHEEKRKTDRCISETEIRHLIDRDAWPFEYYNGHGVEKLGLIGFLKFGKSYRPIHIILKRNVGERWYIVTVYDPRSENFRWADNYQLRVCFCR